MRNIMHTYLLLKNGSIHIVWSDNSSDETYDIYPISMRNTFNVEFDTVDTVNYSDVVVTDTNESVIDMYKKRL